MILEEATYDTFGYYASEVKVHSGKRIMAACDDCGKVRETTKNHYHSLCLSCAQKGERNSNFGKHPWNLDIAATEETKALMSAAQKGKIFTEEHKVNLSAAKRGEKHPNWQGGKSFEPYCVKFNEAYKQLIRTKFNNRCFWCGMSTEYNGRELDVHHVNYNKRCRCDGTKCICVPLCIRCHLKTNTDRDRWQEKIMKKLELSGIQVED
jgi:hypothetical protein